MRLPINGILPTIGAGSSISGVVIGRATLGSRVNVEPGAVIRADINDVLIGDDVKIGSSVVMHVAKYNPAGRSLNTVVGDRCEIGAGAVLHACHLKDDIIVGPGAIILDGAVVESGAIIMPGALIAPFKHIASGQIWSGLPAQHIADRGQMPISKWSDLAHLCKS